MKKLLLAFACLWVSLSCYGQQSLDFAEALESYRKAAEQGHPGAQFLLGGMYFYGLGVAKDDAEAVKWYRKAAEQGDEGAQHKLGLMYAKGSGVATDDAEAVKWYRKAAEQGHCV